MAKSKQPKVTGHKVSGKADGPGPVMVEREIPVVDVNPEPPAADAVTDLSEVEKKAEEERMETVELPATAVAELEKGETVTSATTTPTKLGTYNPATHFAVNKAHFSQLIVNLIAGRTKMYARGAMPSRLIELLDLKGTAEAQKIISDIYNKVAGAA